MINRPKTTFQLFKGQDQKIKKHLTQVTQYIIWFYDIFFSFFFGRVKTGNPAQSKCMQMPYSVGLDLVRPTKNPRYLNLSGFPT